MSCLHCADPQRRGRFCHRCGKLVPQRAVAAVRPVVGARRLPARSQPGPGARLVPAARTARADGVVQGTAAAGAAPPGEAAIKRLFDLALARAAVRPRASLQRYLAVLAATS